MQLVDTIANIADGVQYPVGESIWFGLGAEAGEIVLIAPSKNIHPRFCRIELTRVGAIILSDH
jgi:hypothetical protein